LSQEAPYSYAVLLEVFTQICGGSHMHFLLERNVGPRSLCLISLTHANVHLRLYSQANFCSDNYSHQRTLKVPLVVVHRVIDAEPCRGENNRQKVTGYLYC